MPQLNNFCQVWKILEQLTPMLPLPSFVSVEVSVNLSIWLAPHLLYVPQTPLSYLMRCFAQCAAVDTSDHAWHQARLGLCSLTQHSPAAYNALLCSSCFRSQSQRPLASAIHLFNSSLPLSEAINSEVLLLTLVIQRALPPSLGPVQVSSFQPVSHILA